MDRVFAPIPRGLYEFVEDRGLLFAIRTAVPFGKFLRERLFILHR
jgi:hypothetical protein|tara:strand:- start:141 stop:275 length:135 start_codon:yes stop_codon:yes gene_type:complete